MNTSFFAAALLTLSITACSDSNDKTGEKSEGQGILDNVTSMTKDTVEATKDMTASSMESAKEVASDAMESAKEKTGEVVDAGKEMGSAAMDKASATAEQVADATGDALVAAKEKGQELTSAAMDKTTDMVSSAKDSAAALMPATSSPAVETASADVETEQGQAIYKGNCFACHGAGVAGAPKLEDKEAWSVRIAQGDDVLYKHAIEGFQGKTGFMPAKGGFMNLSDDEVKAAVRYMVSEAQ